MIGQTLGHYELVEKIGAGGMGEVYRAHDRHLERDVALKILPAGMLANESARQRFRREALALSRLNHPNIATVFDFSTQDGIDFLAMELISGTSLGTRVKDGPLPSEEVSQLGIQLAEGLAAAHAQGLIHRDLKPGNLMVTSDGRLKILDFGLAVLVQPEGDVDVTRSVTASADLPGTLPYMSPEQLSGLPVDSRSDIYAAGAVLYEIATGQRPFPQSQTAELIGAILHQPPVAPITQNILVTPALERVVLKALDKDPANRFQSARELLKALQDLEAADAVPPRKRLGGPVAMSAGAALLVVLLLGLAIVVNIGGVRERLFARHNAARASEAVISATVPQRRSVAVLGFKNLSGREDEAWLSTALSEMLTTELGAGEKVRTVPSETVARMKVDLALADAESYAPQTLKRIHKNLGTDYILMGSYLALGKIPAERFEWI